VKATAPRVLVVAGLDPSGGAGLAADVEALLAVGARALPVATALTVQGPRGALGFEAVSARLLRGQIEGLFQGPGLRPRAVKTGMLAKGDHAALLANLLCLSPLARLPVVVDPVIAASSGLPLLRGVRGGPGAALAPLLARATLATPNLPELAALTGAVIRSDDDAVDAARILPSRAVLVKGGHRRGAPVDLLVTRGAVVRLPGRRRPGAARGTGCRLASAIAGLLARGAPLEEAVREAKRVVERYLDAASRPCSPARG
jgi:hydroxymethylpyrimidine/phosphomethylpyrimidine kinase